MDRCRFLARVRFLFFWVLLCLFLFTMPVCHVVGAGRALQSLNPKVSQGDTLLFVVVAQFRAPGIAVRIFGKTFTEDKSRMIYVGVDPDTPPGKYIAFLADSRTGVPVGPSDYQEIEISKRNFREVKLSFKAPSVKSARRAKEAAAISAAYARGNTYDKYATGKYVYPTEAPVITGEFYSKRIYTDRVVAHRGVDLRTAKGVPIKAINAGKVVLAVKRFSLEGNAVIVDHGSGIFSVYLHLSKLEVKEGQTVKAGRVIGLAGATGDARGPHLHFMIKVNGVAVDPLRFIDTINRYLK